MRLEITLKPKEQSINLPLHYNTLLRGFFYKHLSAKDSEMLHKVGYSVDKKTFRMFTFSQLRGINKIYYDRNYKQKRIEFKGKVQVQFSSVDAEDLMNTGKGQRDTDVLIGLARNLLKAKTVCLGESKCAVDSVNIIKTPEVNLTKAVKIKMLSPITLHSTFRYSDQSQGTHYYHPFDGHWEDGILNNLFAKAESLNWNIEPQDYINCYISNLCINRTDKKVINDKGFWIEGWSGHYEIMLPSDLFWLAYKAGLGERNSTGFGMFEIIE